MMNSLFPSSESSLVSASKSLFAESQRHRNETTDDGISPYMVERRKFYNPDQWSLLLTQLSHTTTLYVGNLSFYTNEEQLYEFFSGIGNVLRLVMGLNQNDLTPCGFCFVEFATHEQALNCQRHCSGLMLDERVIRADLDPGFEEGRQFGRSKITGGQRRDDHRLHFDAGRGGYVLNQTNTFSSFIPGVITQLTPVVITNQTQQQQGVIHRARRQKRQKIDLTAVRAQRAKEQQQQTEEKIQQPTTTAAGNTSASRPVMMHTDTSAVGNKRSRRDDDHEEDQDADDAYGNGSGAAEDDGYTLLKDEEEEEEEHEKSRGDDRERNTTGASSDTNVASSIVEVVSEVDAHLTDVLE